MITLNQLVYNLKNLIRGGRLSDDEMISDRQLEFIINYTRAVLIKRDIDKGKKIDDQLIQSLGHVKVKLAHPSECTDLAVGCKILKTEKALPKSIESNYANLITYVGTVSGAKSYQFATEARSRWSKFDKYTSKLPRAFYRGGYVFITENKVMTTISIKGVFEDPREVASFIDCNGAPCYTVDSPYPIPAYMIAPLNEMILNKEFRLAALSPTDTTNNARADYQTTATQN